MAETINVRMTFNSPPKLGDPVYEGLNGKARTTPPSSGSELIGKVVGPLNPYDDCKAFVQMRWDVYKAMPDNPLKLPGNHETPLTIECVGGIARTVAGHVIQSFGREISDKLDDWDERNRKCLASLGLKHVEQAKLIEMMTQRLLDLEKEADDLVTAEPVSLADVLRLVDGRVAQLTEAEASLDKVAWKVFDSLPALKLAGGHYNLGFLTEDIAKVSGLDDGSTIYLALEDLTATALRWCHSRTRWLRNARFWVQSCAGCLIIKRNRFIFQVNTPPEEAMILDS